MFGYFFFSPSSNTLGSLSRLPFLLLSAFISFSLPIYSLTSPFFSSPLYHATAQMLAKSSDELLGHSNNPGLRNSDKTPVVVSDLHGITMKVRMTFASSSFDVLLN